MNILNKIPSQIIIREMYSHGWISFDLYINGGVSIDLILMFSNKVEIIQQDPEINFDIHCYNNVTVNSQIKAYKELIEDTEWTVDYFTEPILQRYKDQLSNLKYLQGLISVQSN